MEKLLTKGEVCELLSVSRATLDRIVAAGELDALRIGGQVRFDRTELERYVRSCRKAGARTKTAPKEKRGPGRPRGSKNRVVAFERYVPGMKVV